MENKQSREKLEATVCVYVVHMGLSETAVESACLFICRFVVVDATTGTLRYYKNHPTITFAKYKVTEHPKGKLHALSNVVYGFSQNFIV